jgi:hypothetical protein
MRLTGAQIAQVGVIPGRADASVSRRMDGHVARLEGATCWHRIEPWHSCTAAPHPHRVKGKLSAG